MKYYDKVPKNFLLIRLVTTRYCNYRCPYCYVPLSKKERKKTMFSHHHWREWLRALKINFSDKTLEFYFTGGEPLLVKDCLLLLRELVKWKNVIGIRIDSNLSTIEFFLKHIKSKKIGFLTAFHPTQVSLKTYLKKVKLVKGRGMLSLVNFVASQENLKVIKMAPHELVKLFAQEGIFLNIARDFHRGLTQGYGYDKNYKKYIDMLQYPLDNFYMDLRPINKGFLCGGGKHYITINRHGQVFSCGNKMARTLGHGNIFSSLAKLPKSLTVCQENGCPSIISYSFSCSNEYSPVSHAKDYVQRCREVREGISKEFLDNLWQKIDIDKLFSEKKEKSIHRKIKEKLKRILM